MFEVYRKAGNVEILYQLFSRLRRILPVNNENIKHKLMKLSIS